MGMERPLAHLALLEEKKGPLSAVEKLLFLLSSITL